MAVLFQPMATNFIFPPNKALEAEKTVDPSEI
jgi:hypothetical protein